MPKHMSARRQALINLGDAINALHTAKYGAGDNPLTREQARLIARTTKQDDSDALLHEAVRHLGRDEHVIRELDLFIDEDMHGPGFDPFDWLSTDQDRLTPAEFHCMRQWLGLTSQWLADRWNVAERSVKRWEANRLLPYELTEDMQSLQREFDEQVHQWATDVMEHGSIIMVPRKTPFNTEWPAGWWQAIATQVRLRTHATIVYDDDTEDWFSDPDDDLDDWEAGDEQA